jgi:hypothetical protein
MVADITGPERAAEEQRRGLHTTKAQLAYGGHVLATMFTFFMLAYYGTKHFLGKNELWVSVICCQQHVHILCVRVVQGCCAQFIAVNTRWLGCDSFAASWVASSNQIERCVGLAASAPPFHACIGD